MKRFSLKKKIVAGVAVTALAVGVGGAAFAFWTTGGSGTGTASTGSSTPVQLAAAFPQISNLGGTVTATSATVQNTSAAPVSVAGKSLAIGSVDCTGGLGPNLIGVPAPWFTLGGTLTAPSAEIPATTTVPFTGPVTLTLNNVSLVDQNSCQGAVVTVHLTLTP